MTQPLKCIQSIPGTTADCPPGSRKNLCPVGFYCPTDSSSRIVCPVGSYCPEGVTQSLPCDPKLIGTYCGTYSAIQDLCPAGSYCPSFTDRKDCPVGSYCPKGSTNPLPCDPKLIGTYCGPKSINQDLCPVGFYCPTITSRISCPEPKYCRDAGFAAIPALPSISDTINNTFNSLKLTLSDIKTSNISYQTSCLYYPDPRWDNLTNQGSVKIGILANLSFNFGSVSFTGSKITDFSNDPLTKTIVCKVLLNMTFTNGSFMFNSTVRSGSCSDNLTLGSNPTRFSYPTTTSSTSFALSFKYDTNATPTISNIVISGIFNDEIIKNTVNSFINDRLNDLVRPINDFLGSFPINALNIPRIGTSNINVGFSATSIVNTLINNISSVIQITISGMNTFRQYVNPNTLNYYVAATTSNMSRYGSIAMADFNNLAQNMSNTTYMLYQNASNYIQTIIAYLTGDFSFLVGIAINYYNKHATYFENLGNKLINLPENEKKDLSEIITAIISGQTFDKVGYQLENIGEYLGFISIITESYDAFSAVDFPNSSFGIDLSFAGTTGVNIPGIQAGSVGGALEAGLGFSINTELDIGGNRLGGVSFGISAGAALSTIDAGKLEIVGGLGVSFSPNSLENHTTSNSEQIVVNVIIKPPRVPIVVTFTWLLYDIITKQNVTNFGPEPTSWNLGLDMVGLATGQSKEFMAAATVGYSGFKKSGVMKSCAHNISEENKEQMKTAKKRTTSCYDRNIKNCRECPSHGEIYSISQKKCVLGYAKPGKQNCLD